MNRVVSDFRPVIELASLADVPSLPGIEARAAGLLDPQDLPAAIAAETTPVATYRTAVQEGRVLVARLASGGVAGFALMTEVDGSSHLEELDVDPEYGRRGLGRALVAAATEWAAKRGDASITLSTFKHVPWNAPFYATMGFKTLPTDQLSPALQTIIDHEEAMGLNVSKRVVMRRDVS